MPADQMKPQWAGEYEAHAKTDWSTTQLSPDEEIKFRQWITNTKMYQGIKREIAEEQGLPVDQLDDNRVIDMVVDSPENDYDYRGAYKNGMQEEVSPHDGLPHWSSRADNGAWLKSPNHPTAWKEFFMNAYGVDPDYAGLDTYDKALAATATKEGVKQMTKTAQERMWNEEAAKRAAATE